MITPHESFQQPDRKDASIWRYLDLAKFVHLLQTRNLYFSRADKLGDKFEGSNTAAAAAFFEQLCAPGYESELAQLYPGMEPDRARHAIKDLRRLRKEMLDQVFVSCWHLAERESAAMWSLYGGVNASVAIRLPYSSLAEALPSGVFMGQVRYIDWAASAFDQGNSLEPFIHKRVSFEHEREVRAVLWCEYFRASHADTPMTFQVSGVQLPIDLPAKLTGIYVSPAAPAFFEDVVQGLCNSYGVNLKVQQSELSSPAVY